MRIGRQTPPLVESGASRNGLRCLKRSDADASSHLRAEMLVTPENGGTETPVCADWAFFDPTAHKTRVRSRSSLWFHGESNVRCARQFDHHL
jgi:hypothetical protein